MPEKKIHTAPSMRRPNWVSFRVSLNYLVCQTSQGRQRTDDILCSVTDQEKSFQCTSTTPCRYPPLLPMGLASLSQLNLLSLYSMGEAWARTSKVEIKPINKIKILFAENCCRQLAEISFPIEHPKQNAEMKMKKTVVLREFLKKYIKRNFR